MSAFSNFWKHNAFYGNPEQRMTQIVSMMESIDKEMQSKVDPTRWRKLLDQKQDLEKEMEGFKMGNAPLRMI